MSFEKIGAVLGNTDEEKSAGSENLAENKKSVGPLSDSFEDAGPESSARVNIAELLEQLNVSREPNKEVNINDERIRVTERLEKVKSAIKEEKEKSAPFEEARERLGISQTGSGGGIFEKLEEAREKLEKENHQIELAEEYNDVLQSFSEFSLDELKSIQETGKTRDGKEIRNKMGKIIHSDMAKELASFYANGGQRITWGALNKLSAIMDKLLGDILHPIKKFLHLEGNK